MLARRCVPEPSNKEERSVVEAQFYSIPVGLHRLCPARYSEWDEAIKGQYLVVEGETSLSHEPTIKLQILI